MSATLYPGVQFYAEVIADTHTLRRTPSTYSYGNRLELVPRRNDLYVICADGSVQSVWESERPIGWEVFETENGWAYRITQVGFEPQPCLVRFHSRADTIRPGSRGVGTCVFVERRVEPIESKPDGEITDLSVSFSRFAAIYEAEEDGEPEVTSTPPPECPGAPRKAARNIAFGSAIDIARSRGDSEEVEALEKFSQGELSYAEMRMRCG